MTTVTPSEGRSRSDGPLVRAAIAFTAWAERWFPEAFTGRAVTTRRQAFLSGGCSGVARFSTKSRKRWNDSGGR